jgi:hypothetical protein
VVLVWASLEQSGSAVPIRQSLRRLPYGKRQTEKEKILRMLDLGVIEPFIYLEKKTFWCFVNNFDDVIRVLIHFSCSFKFLITILSFYCVFVHPCSICSSYTRFVFVFDVYFLRFHSDFRAYSTS